MMNNMNYVNNMNNMNRTPQPMAPQPSDFETKRIIIANLLAAIIREIDAIPDPQQRAYFEPLYLDANKHLNDIRLQLIREGKLRLSL